MRLFMNVLIAVLLLIGVTTAFNVQKSQHALKSQLISRPPCFNTASRSCDSTSFSFPVRPLWNAASDEPAPAPDASPAIDPAQIAMWGELVRRLVTPEEGTMEEAVEQYLDMCDYGFLNYLNQQAQLAELAGSQEADQLKAVQEEINAAMQRRLVAADERLRQILSAGELKTMEAMTRDMMRNNGLDMPFMVILNMNIAQAKEAGAEEAERVLQHLFTFIQEEQDKTLPANVQLLRRLLRTTCSGVRADMMKQKLILENVDIPEEERIWGKAEVEPEALFEAIEDVLFQSADFDQDLDTGVTERIVSLKEEIQKFLETVSK